MKQAFVYTLLLLMTLNRVRQEKENHARIVTNVVAEQVDFEYVSIRYDVEDADGDMVTVSVKFRLTISSPSVCQ